MNGRIDSSRRHKSTTEGIGSSSSFLSFKDHWRLGTDRNVCPTVDRGDGLRSIPRRSCSQSNTSLLASPCLRTSVVSLPPAQREAAQ